VSSHWVCVSSELQRDALWRRRESAVEAGARWFGFRTGVASGGQRSLLEKMKNFGQ
jgi:hypothetical protein